MKEVKIGCVIYTYNEDGTITRTIDETKQAEMLAKIQKLKEE